MTDLTVVLQEERHQGRDQRGHEGRLRGPSRASSSTTPTRSSPATSSATRIPASSSPTRPWSIGGNLVKVIGWYDNEWGYSNRTADLITKLGSSVAVAFAQAG